MSATNQDFNYYQDLSLGGKYEELNNIFNILSQRFDNSLRSDQRAASSVILKQLQMLSEQMGVLAEKMRASGSIGAPRYTQAHKKTEEAVAARTAQLEEASDEPSRNFSHIATFAQSQLLFSFFSHDELARTAEVSRGWESASRNSWRSCSTLPPLSQEEVQQALNKAEQLRALQEQLHALNPIHEVVDTFAPDEQMVQMAQTKEGLVKEILEFTQILVAHNQWDDVGNIFKIANGTDILDEVTKERLVTKSIAYLLENQAIGQALLLAEQSKQWAANPDRKYAEWILPVIEHLAANNHLHLALQLANEKLQEPWKSEAILLLATSLINRNKIDKAIELAQLCEDREHQQKFDKILMRHLIDEQAWEKAFEILSGWPESPMQVGYLDQIFQGILYVIKRIPDNLEIAFRILNHSPALSEDPEAISSLAMAFTEFDNFARAYHLQAMLPEDIAIGLLEQITEESHHRAIHFAQLGDIGRALHIVEQLPPQYTHETLTEIVGETKRQANMFALQGEMERAFAIVRLLPEEYRDTTLDKIAYIGEGRAMRIARQGRVEEALHLAHLLLPEYRDRALEEIAHIGEELAIQYATEGDFEEARLTAELLPQREAHRALEQISRIAQSYQIRSNL